MKIKGPEPLPQKISELEPEYRLAFLNIVREFASLNPELVANFGFEKTEEELIKLIEEGILRVLYDKREDALGLAIWDFISERYVAV